MLNRLWLVVGAATAGLLPQGAQAVCTGESVGEFAVWLLVKWGGSSARGVSHGTPRAAVV
jgi:hypothetical protein